MGLAVDISSHGYGHPMRIAPVMRAGNLHFDQLERETRMLL